MIKFQTIQEYEIARNKYDKNHEAVKKYLKENKTNAIPMVIANTFPFANEVNHDLTSAIEVWEFIHDIPENYFIYVSSDKKTVTTWTGQKLGNIVSTGKVFRSNMGDKRQHITINAINNCRYAGYYFMDAGSYARIKKLKS